MGTPSFAIPSLEELLKHFEVVGVITQQDKPAGRGQKLTPPPVKEYALRKGLKCFQPESKGEIYAIVKELKPQCVVVVAYGRILPKEVLELPNFGCINLHASLLPKYRGGVSYTEEPFGRRPFNGQLGHAHG